MSRRRVSLPPRESAGCTDHGRLDFGPHRVGDGRIGVTDVACDLALSERIPALLGHVMSRGTVALPSVAWYFHPVSFTATASMAAPISALRRRSIGVGPACAVSPCTSTCMPRTAYPEPGRSVSVR